ncbi:MAG TPA: hypothetical protein VGN57_05735 [Pirellulaceae bacterium]|jgi:predicted nucleotidyltransferase|nr:hypothetical protein [Pirellulaceae bacterium]
MTPSSFEPPFRRPFPLAEWFSDDASPARKAWERSAAAIETIRHRIDVLGEAAIAAVAISGSLGRMEGREDSDWDLIFLLRENAKFAAADAIRGETLNAFGRSLWEHLDPEGLRRPEPGGIFVTPVAASELADPRFRGSLSDSPSRFGKRIQLLLDCQTIWGDPVVGRAAALRFYGIEGPGQEETATRSNRGPEVVFLFNDLVRYHRSLCTMTQWLPNPASDKARRLKLKLRFSRFLNYLGLLLPLAQGIDCGNVAESLAPFWSLTPLERILAFADPEPHAARELCRSYEGFLAFLERSDPAEAEWQGVEAEADRFRVSACELLRSQPFLQRGRAADLLLL